MGHKQLPATSGLVQQTVNTSAPSGDVGINLATLMPEENARWRKVILTVTVAGSASNIILWAKRAAGVAGSSADDVWGLFSDMFGNVKLGVVATALPVGTYHFTIPDVGPYAALYVQSSAGTVSATFLPIQEIG